jgi:hypothetical protein
MTTSAEGSTRQQRTPAAEPTQDKLVADIEQTRRQLGDTIDALTAKVDVKARARAQADATRLRLRQQMESAKSLARRVPPSGALVAATAVAAISLVVLIRRSRR